MKKPLTEETAPDGPVTWEDVSALMGELKQMARGFLGKEGHGRPIKTTGLVLSAFRRLQGAGKDWATAPKRDWGEVSWANREEFFAHTRRVMRQALVEYARTRKRRGEYQAGALQSADLAPLVEAGALSWESFAAAITPERAEVLAEALEKLERDYPHLAAVVHHRFFDDLTLDEIALLLDITEKTVRNRLDLARVTLWEFLGSPAA